MVLFFSLLFLDLLPQQKPVFADCVDNSDCTYIDYGTNECRGDDIWNQTTPQFCNHTVDPPQCAPDFSRDKIHVENCPCGCSGGSCIPCKTCNYDSSYPQNCCGDGLRELVDKYVWSDGSGVCNYVTNCNQPDATCKACVANQGQECGTYGCCGDGGGEAECYKKITCEGNCEYAGIRNEGAYCGNGQCKCNENSSNCPQDCPPPPTCPNGSCDNGENCTSCPNDCGVCPIAKYRCNGASCIRDDASGNFTSSDCNNACTSTAKYRCSGSSCIRDDAGGSYTSSNCDNACVSAIPPTPTISTTLSCLVADGYNGDKFTISWASASPPVTYVDISTSSNFSTYSNKPVSGTSTTAPAGFSSNLTFNVATTYYVRLWNGSTHSNTASFTTPAICPECPEGLGACGDAGPSSSSIGTCSGTWINAGNLNYNAWCNYKTNSSRGICYSCNAAIVTPWIQVTGDVHSNTGINAPGGP